MIKIIINHYYHKLSINKFDDKFEHSCHICGMGIQIEAYYSPICQSKLINFMFVTIQELPLPTFDYYASLYRWWKGGLGG